MKLQEVLRISIINGEVLVRIHDAGINPVDWKVRQGYPKQLSRQRCDEQVQK